MAALLLCVAIGTGELRQGEAAESKAMIQSTDRVITFGDSVTRLAYCPDAANCNFKGDGWATMLKRDLAAQGLTPEIISAGIGGDTTVDLLSRVQRDVLEKKPTARS